jgi:hypothetical protein
VSERCDLTDLLKTDCAHCRPKPAKPLASGPTIAAQFDGECACGCEKEIVEGEQITHSNEAGGWCKASHVRTLEM